MDRTVDAVRHLMLGQRGVRRARRGIHHAVINAAKAVAMQRDGELGRMLAACDLVNADGQAIVWTARLLGRPLPERVTGIDLMEELLKLCEREDYSVYFLGAEANVLESFVHAVRGRYPQLRIAGYHHGYFNEEESRLVVARIRKSLPDMLFVGMDTPRKEYWLSRNLDRLGVPFSMGVGGAFDVWAGKKRRAPEWMQLAGLEWLFRLTQDPRRLWRRYLVGNTAFMWLVAKELWRERVLGREAARHSSTTELEDEALDEPRLAG